MRAEHLRVAERGFGGDVFSSAILPCISFLPLAFTASCNAAAVAVSSARVK